VSQFAAEYNSSVAINGGFFGVTNSVGTSYSLSANNNNIESHNIPSVTRSSQKYYPTRCAVGVDSTGKFEANWVYASPDGTLNAYDRPSPNQEGLAPQDVPNATFPSNSTTWNIRHGVGGGPMLLHNKEFCVNSSWDAEVMWGSGVNKPPSARTAVGFGYPPSYLVGEDRATKQHLMLIVVDGQENKIGASLFDMAFEFQKLGAEGACNLDGGGSSTFVVDKTRANYPNGGTVERSLAVSLMIFAR
jgi:exopolysaccharide biosynthesis protein